jgi:bacterioferritin (cytochrome b1)
MTLPQFLELMTADLRNEWTHLQFYLYHASAVAGLHAHEYKEFFTAAAKGEMAHVQAFLDRLFGLNVATPPVGGHDFPRFTAVEHALSHAMQLEQDVVENYATRLTQLDELAAAHPTTAAYLKVFYEDQLQDSYEDLEHMRRLTHDLLPNLVARARTRAE